MGFLSSITKVFTKVVSWFVDIPEPQKQQSGVLLNKESNLAPIPVVYGQRKIGGTRVFVETAGNKNKYLYICLVLCEGEIQEIGDVYINDILSTDSKYSGLITIDKKLGTDDQTASTVLLEADSWTSDHRLRGVAYLGMKFEWNQKVFSSIPDVKAVVKGRKVYDPRTTTTVYSTNTALCLLDYLRNARYGKGLPDGSFESGFSSWQTAANVCDTSVTEYSGGSSVPLFSCNAIIDVSKNVFDNTKQLLAGMQGLLTYSQGKYKLIIEGQGTPSYAFTEDNILGQISVTGVSKKDRFNRVIATFTNPEKNWQEDQIEYPEAGSAEYTSLLAEDNGFELEKRAALDVITNQYQARNIANTILYKSRNGLACGFKATTDALQVTVGDIVSITHSGPGWSAKAFRINELTLNNDGSVDVVAQEHQNSVYSWYEGAQLPDYDDTILPDPFIVAAPTGLTVTSSVIIQEDGTALPLLDISWTAADDAFVNEYEVGYSTDGTNYISVITADTSYALLNVDTTETYYIRVRSVNSIGSTSDYVYSLAIDPTADTTAPATPTGLTAVAGLGFINLSWNNNTEFDLKGYYLYENTVNNPSTATHIASISADRFSRGGLDYGVTRYYWISAVDYTGNESAKSTGVSSTTLFIDDDSFADGIYGLFIDAGLSAPEIVSSLPSTNNFQGRLVFLTTDNKLYRWTGSAWTSAVPTTDLSGTITETQIANDAITTPKIAANAITATEIAGNTITGDKIVANTITGGLLATSGIITSSAQIDDAVITNAKIENISADKINAGSLSADYISIDNLTIDTDGSGNLIVKDAGIDTRKINTNAVTVAGFSFGGDGGEPDAIPTTFSVAAAVGTSEVVTVVNATVPTDIRAEDSMFAVFNFAGTLIRSGSGDDEMIFSVKRKWDGNEKQILYYPYYRIDRPAAQINQFWIDRFNEYVWYPATTTNFLSGSRPQIVKYLNGYYVIAAANQNSGLLHIYYSQDAYTWSNAVVVDNTQPIEGARGLDYIDGKWVLLSYSKRIWTSTNLTSWTNQGSLAYIPYDMHVYENRAIACLANSYVVYSTDGINWTTSTTSIGYAPTNFTYANGQYVFCGGNGEITTSPTGIDSYTLRTSGVTSNLNGVAYGNNTYVVVGSGGVILYSKDNGVTWTAATSGTTDTFTNVQYSDAENKFLAVLIVAGGLLESGDGVIWTTATLPGINTAVECEFTSTPKVIVESGSVSGSQDVLVGEYVSITEGTNLEYELSLYSITGTSQVGSYQAYVELKQR